MGFEMVIAQSFAKILGLYGERVGALHFVQGDKSTIEKMLSNLKIIIRCNYSSPPRHGARIAAIIFNDPELRKQWQDELQNVTNRMIEMRQLLKKKL
jgi:aspartate/tyrosine/aromatic aminotransferase